MGTEISQDRFTQADFREFRQRLQRETRLLAQLLNDGSMASTVNQAGYELEAWLIAPDGQPAPDNQPLLASVEDNIAVAELARFNIELNGTPQPLQGNALSLMHEEMRNNWSRLSAAAGRRGLRLLMIGSHPSARREDFCLANMSPLQRYRAINTQILHQRQGRPVQLDIQGIEHLHHQHADVMLEAATTSFQIHLRCSPQQSAHLYNLSKMLSAPLVALSANSPFLFGHDLWAESRIPIFEQAIDVGQSDLTRRVSFGVRYVEDSIMEVFQANLARYPVLLPELFDTAEEQLAHLRLHNGTIWRWNRPLVGFDPDGQPHIRIEQRGVPAGPTACDAMANAAFYLGASHRLLHSNPTLERDLPFASARENFYRCARHGLQARVHWPGQTERPVRALILEQLLPQAAEGLEALNIPHAEAAYWLGILRNRVTSGQTGSQWQRLWIQRHGKDFRGMIDTYHQHQQTDQPVHSWPV
jgi:gamma-glutamyl:cysteine ligase YbdK (ATP-grasp superfamily)